MINALIVSDKNFRSSKIRNAVLKKIKSHPITIFKFFNLNLDNLFLIKDLILKDFLLVSEIIWGFDI